MVNDAGTSSKSEYFPDLAIAGNEFLKVSNADISNLVSNKAFNVLEESIAPNVMINLSSVYLLDFANISFHVSLSALLYNISIT